MDSAKSLEDVGSTNVVKYACTNYRAPAPIWRSGVSGKLLMPKAPVYHHT
jgi:hypothetical protein